MDAAPHPYEAVDEEEEPTGDGHRTRNVVTGSGVPLALLDDSGHRKGGDQGNRYVDEECPPPRGELGERSTQHEPDGGTAAGDGSVHAECSCSFVGLRERDGEQRESRRCHHRGEGTLQGPGPEEHRGVLRQPTESGRGGESQQTEEEHPLASEEVGNPTSEQEQAAEGQRVGTHDPLPIRNRDVQRTLRGRQRDDDH